MRKHLDWVKGGGLARMLGPAPILTLALSDVVGDDLTVIASGPTAPDPTTFGDACRVLDRFGLRDSRPGGRRDAAPTGCVRESFQTPRSLATRCSSACIT